MEICKRELIRRHDGPYLDRFIIFGCEYVKVMVHRFLASDDECLHCHPWDFLSIILRGGYREWIPMDSIEAGLGDVPGVGQTSHWYSPGRILFRRAEWAHRIEINPNRWPVTLVITGPRRRAWGFFTKFGWISWRRYKHSKHCA